MRGDDLVAVAFTPYVKIICCCSLQSSVALLVLQFDVVKPCKTTKVRTVLQFTPNKKSIFTKKNYNM